MNKVTKCTVDVAGVITNLAKADLSFANKHADFTAQLFEAARAGLPVPELETSVAGLDKDSIKYKTRRKMAAYQSQYRNAVASFAAGENPATWSDARKARMQAATNDGTQGGQAGRAPRAGGKAAAPAKVEPISTPLAAYLLNHIAQLVDMKPTAKVKGLLEEMRAAIASGEAPSVNAVNTAPTSKAA